MSEKASISFCVSGVSNGRGPWFHEMNVVIPEMKIYDQFSCRKSRFTLLTRMILLSQNLSLFSKVNLNLEIPLFVSLVPFYFFVFTDRLQCLTTTPWPGARLPVEHCSEKNV